MDRDTDRHGEQEQGRNKKKEAAGLLSDKKLHTREMR